MEQFEEQPCLHDENEDTAQETGLYKLPEGAVAAHKVDEDFGRLLIRQEKEAAAESVCAMQLQGCALWCFL